MGLRTVDVVDHLMNGVLPEIAYTDLDFFECLSQGTYGTVYRGKYLPRNQIVAIKRVLVLEKEAHVLSLLRHKNIIQFYGAVTHPPNFCIVLEYASKGSLHAFLSDNTLDNLSFAKILQWATDIARGVHYLHNEAPVKMVHRDLKSKNIVISSDDICKLCDFGTSKALLHTTQMSVVGTVAWMSPEMIQSQPVAESTDTWSYAVVLWELLTRQVPFRNLESFRIAWMVVEENVRLPVPSTCPSKFAEIMVDCWNKDPKMRPSFVDILHRLQAIGNDKRSSTETDSYLNNAEHWKQEIEEHNENLKQRERDLSDRETRLSEWEGRLSRREQNIEQSRRMSTQLTHDVNLWHEDDVIIWVQRLTWWSTADTVLVSSLAMLFRQNHINGQRLLMLTDNDLRNLGLSSVGYRRHLLNEIEQLSVDNLRLINFPPLSTAAKSPKLSEHPLNITLLFGIYVRHGAGLNTHKWKLLMDVDDADGWENPNGLIKEVRFVVQDAPYVYKALEPPFVMRDWSTGFKSDLQVQCVVTFSDLVHKPRNTKFLLDIDYERRGSLAEKVVELFVKAPKPTNNMNSIRTSPKVVTSSPSSNLHEVHSTPALQGAWQDKTFRDAVPSINWEQRQSTATPQKSPLWAQIVAGLRGGGEIKSNTSSLPRNVTDSALLTLTAEEQKRRGLGRAISDEPTSMRPVSFYLGNRPHSVDEAALISHSERKQHSIRYSRTTSQNNQQKNIYDNFNRKYRRAVSNRESFNVNEGDSTMDSRRFAGNGPPTGRAYNRAESAGYWSQTSSPDVRTFNKNGPRFSNERRVSLESENKRPQTLLSLNSNASGSDKSENTLSPVFERAENGHSVERGHSSERKDNFFGNNSKETGPVQILTKIIISKRRRKPVERSSTSVAIHGGYEKWKWKAKE